MLASIRGKEQSGNRLFCDEIHVFDELGGLLRSSKPDARAPARAQQQDAHISL
jgi:hypothetical protein